MERAATILSALVILLAIVAGCARRPAEAPPAPRGPWIELRSPHFVVRTDIASPEAERRVGEFEQIYQAFTEIAFPTDENRSGVLHVVLFADFADYSASGPKGSDGAFSGALPNDLEPEPTIRMSGELTGDTRRLFQHELTHHFLYRSLPRFPIWLNEGMAEFYSTLDISPGHVTLGAARPDVGITRAHVTTLGKIDGRKVVLFSRRELPRVRNLVAMDTVEFRNRGLFAADWDRLGTFRNYTGAWGLVHLMMTGPEAYRARFGRYIESLSRGRAPSRAWAETFGDVDPQALQREYDEHVSADTVSLLRTRFEPRPVPPPSVHPMSAAEVHIMKARLVPWTKTSPPFVRMHLDAAVHAEPESPEARYWRAIFLAEADGDLHGAEVELLAALAKSPEDPRYLLGLARVATMRTAPAAELIALGGRLAKTARTAPQLDEAAELFVLANRPDDALPLVERAIKADPICRRCVVTHAAVLSDKGRDDEADAELEHAIMLLPEDVDPALVRKLRGLMKHPPPPSHVEPTRTEGAQGNKQPGSQWEELP